MNKEWFIFKGTHHLGPYSKEEMAEFYANGELTAHSLVWREGAEKWEALNKSRELSYMIVPEEDEFPDLPPLPPIPMDDDDAPPPVLPQFLHPQSEDHFDGPPPVPLDALLDPQGSTRTFKKKSGIYSTNSPRIIFASIAVVFAIVLAWFIINEQSAGIQLRVKGLMPVYLEKLQETASQKTPSISLAMALSLDGKTVFASTNKDGEIISIIKLRSIPKRTLGTEEVEIMVRGIIKDHLGEFARMQLIKGPQFVPGEYTVEFAGRRMHFLNRHFKFLNDIEFFKELNTNYNYETQALIFAGTPREFEKKLAEYSETLTTEKLKPYHDKLERLQTFQSLLNKTMEDYLLALEKLSKPKDISGFETNYIKEVSPIIQSLVQEAQAIAQKEEPDANASASVAPFGNQVLLGKEFGELASDMITETGALKKIGAPEKAKLKTKFEARYKTLKAKIDNYISTLQAEIQKIST
jgi:hypothetical protein